MIASAERQRVLNPPDWTQVNIRALEKLRLSQEILPTDVANQLRVQDVHVLPNAPQQFVIILTLDDKSTHAHDP